MKQGYVLITDDNVTARGSDPNRFVNLMLMVAGRIELIIRNNCIRDMGVFGGRRGKEEIM